MYKHVDGVEDGHLIVAVADGQGIRAKRLDETLDARAKRPVANDEQPDVGEAFEQPCDGGGSDLVALPSP